MPLCLGLSWSNIPENPPGGYIPKGLLFLLVESSRTPWNSLLSGPRKVTTMRSWSACCTLHTISAPASTLPLNPPLLVLAISRRGRAPSFRAAHPSPPQLIWSPRRLLWWNLTARNNFANVIVSVVVRQRIFHPAQHSSVGRQQEQRARQPQPAASLPPVVKEEREAEKVYISGRGN